MIRQMPDEHRFNYAALLKFRVTIDVNEMLLLPARILPAPKIEYKSSHGDQSEAIERMQIGKWWLDDCFKKA